MKLILAFADLVIILMLFLVDAGALTFDEGFQNVISQSVENVVEQVFIPLENSNVSIKYSLYTRKNPNSPCFMEPTAEEFDHCPFDPALDTKIFIHGFYMTLKSHGYLDIKDVLLNYGSYNVIYVDWTRYNGHPYFLAVSNTILVAKKVAEFVKFIKKHTRVRCGSFHFIGHSLGAHIAGLVGKKVRNIGRITGLDPAGPLYELKNKRKRLHYTDAKFVDVIHSSDELSGLGLGKFDPIGHMDFYPNGGQTQLEICNLTRKFNASGDISTGIKSLFDVIVCSHMMSVKFFLHSILDCDYLSTKCEDYESLPICSTKGNPTAPMGFFAKRIRNMPRKSKFYLTTSGSKPFC